MKIVFITTPSRTHLPNYIIPTGVLSISAYLEQGGHEVNVVDAAGSRESIASVVERVGKEEPDVIGVSGIITAYAYAVDLIKSVKSVLPNVPIVLGGQIAINTDDLFFEHTPVDYIVHGYGEIAMEKILRHLQGRLSLDDITGVSYKIGNKIVDNEFREFFKHVDEMPLPAYHLVDMEHYATVRGENELLNQYLSKTGKTIKNHRQINIMGTLGCTDKCTFCVHEQEFVGIKIFSNEYLVNHMEFLHNNYGINIFSIGEEMFLTTPKRLRRFNILLRERLPSVFWSCSTRGDYLTEELVAELRKTNCFRVGWGLESASNKMLKLLNKRMTREKNYAAYMNMNKTAIKPSPSLMVGNVGEDFYTVRETVKFVRETNMPLTNPFFATPYPGARIWDWAVEQGIIKDRHKFLLEVSDSDIAGRIHCNLTSFPDWVLKGFAKWISYESFKNDAVFERMPGSLFVKSNIKMFLSVLRGPFYMPTPIVKYVLHLFQLFHDLRRKYIKTKKDLRYSYQVDESSAMRPRALFSRKPQKFIKPEEFIIVRNQIKESRERILGND